MDETKKLEIDGNEFLKRLDLHNLANGRIGHILTYQLFRYHYDGPGNPKEVTREIHSLDRVDGLSRTKKEAVFSSGKLKGFFHKHYFTARHIPLNMYQHNIDGKSEELSKGAGRVISRTLESEVSDDEKAMILADFLTMDAYKQRSRSRNLTGDWIIFKKYQGKNYYLCLASHEVDTDDLYEMIKRWYVPLWPFLF